MAQQSLGYYDTISGLSALECSHKVHLSVEQLQQLCTLDKKARKIQDGVDDNGDENERRIRKRAPVHGYLSKIDATIKLDLSNELQHTLLGGHVPRSQLEALSSTDFANYFHKMVDFEKATQTFDMFAHQATMVATAVPTPTPPPSITPTTTPLTRTEFTETAEAVRRSRPQLNSNNSSSGSSAGGVKKVILCKKCKARFSGPRRFTNMKKHMCMRG
ncbi:LADA_0G04808g1_1 [Lachancea dasiensis]|uniref:LADA_0G04808g1_1 n=1 Tax=Lachancea dasiensis TaxID=1072105 RepID=A0A1G4JSR7_9SACH|nr:LADA_0G04808g1_1 [Lachancea dasiensis]